MMDATGPSPEYRRYTKAQLLEKLHNLENAPTHELRDVLHQLEVYQIELEMQNRELQDSRQALEASLERYVDLYDFAPIGYVTTDSLGVIKDINLTMTRALQAERKWLIDRSLSAWVHKADLRSFRQHMARSKTAGEQVVTELRLVPRDKTVVCVELRTTESSDSVESGLFQTVITDLGARKAAEAERDRFFELSTDLLCVADTSGFFRVVNPAWSTALGYTQEQLLSRPFLDFVHPDDHELVLSGLSAAAHGKTSLQFEARMFREDRSFIWLTWTIVMSGNLYYGVARDTTSQHEAKVDAENIHNWLTEMVAAIPTAIVLVAAGTGDVISTSAQVHNIVRDRGLGIPFEDWTNFSCEDAVGEPVARENLPRYRAARGEVLDGDEFTWRTSTDITHLKVFSRNIAPKYGRAAMALVVYQDVTGLKVTKAALEHSVRKLEGERELRERFVFTLTHDLRTPLAAIKMSSQLIGLRPNDAGTVKHLTGRVLENVERLEGMIHDLLDANRINGGEQLPLRISRCDVAEICRKAIDSLAIVHGDRFRLTGLDSCDADVDPHAIRRVIENLCSNAVKYGCPKAPVTVTVARGERGIRLSVHNEGPSIPETEIPSLFDPFQRTPTAQDSGKKGWGIGLTLVRGIAESHGGSVHVTSRDGEGTTFVLEIPQSQLHLN